MGKQITWDSQYEIGIDVIDNQHKVLFDLANDLNNAANNSASMQVIDTLFSVITNYAFTHFETEEHLFKGDKDYLLHCHQHYKLIRQLYEYSNDYHNGRNGDIDPGTFLDKWLRDHIQDTDIPTFTRQNVDNNQLDKVDVIDTFVENQIEHRENKRLDHSKIIDGEIVSHCFNATKSINGIATILDISVGGMKIQTDNRHDVNDLLILTANIGKNFSMKEKVRIKNKDSSGNFGVEFVSPNTETKKFLTELLGAVSQY